jgi:hypothetical protein
MARRKLYALQGVQWNGCVQTVCGGQVEIYKIKNPPIIWWVFLCAMIVNIILPVRGML